MPEQAPNPEIEQYARPINAGEVEEAIAASKKEAEELENQADQAS